MRDSILRRKSMLFAKKIVFLCKTLRKEHKDWILSNQLLRSGTSIGANIYEANYGQSAKDFLSKMEIAQKECFETEYWLELLFETDYISAEEYHQLADFCTELQKMLTASIKTIRTKKDLS